MLVTASLGSIGRASSHRSRTAPPSTWSTLGAPFRSSSADLNEVTETETAGHSSLSYDAQSGRYHYVWKTDTAWAGTCRRLVLGLNDSSDRAAEFRFR
jgi:hypothetical protein